MNIEKVIGLLEQVILAVKENSSPAVVVESDRFKNLNDGWVLDKMLRIEWGPSSTDRMDWEEAKKHASDKGGRLPTVQELRSLVDYDKHDPAIDKRFFADTKTNDWYWTGTEVAGSSGSAWVVNFYSGYVHNFIKGYDNYVRPVRASQCLII